MPQVLVVEHNSVLWPVGLTLIHPSWCSSSTPLRERREGRAWPPWLLFLLLVVGSSGQRGQSERRTVRLRWRRRPGPKCPLSPGVWWQVERWRPGWGAIRRSVFSFRVVTSAKRQTLLLLTLGLMRLLLLFNVTLE